MATSEYYKAHREERLAYQKARYAQKAEALRAYQRKYSKLNRKAQREYAIRWRSENKARMKESERRRYALHREKFAVKNKTYRKKNWTELKEKRRLRDLKYPERIAARSAIRRTRKLGACMERVDYGAVLKRANGVCAICLKPFDLFGIHFDHKIPLAKGGTHAQDNIQATHAYCNMAKGAKVG